MTNELITFKTCKCCGVERKSTEFDKGNNGKRIGICRKCRNAQQNVSNLSNRDDLTLKQEERLNDAIAWLAACKEATGYETRKRSRVDFNVTEELEKIKQAAEARKLAASKEVL